MKKPADILVDAGTSHSNIECETSDDEYTANDTKTRHLERWSQKELNDLIRDYLKMAMNTLIQT